MGREVVNDIFTKFWKTFDRIFDVHGKLIKAHYCKGQATPPIDSDIGPISTLELSKLCKNKKIIEIQQKKNGHCVWDTIARSCIKRKRMGRGFGIWRPAKRLIIPSKLKLLILGLQRFASSIATLFMLWGFHCGYLKLEKMVFDPERLLHSRRICLVW